MTNGNTSAHGSATPADATTPTASTPASVAAPVRAPAPQRRRRAAVDPAASWRLGVIDLDDIVARVPNGNTPLGADDDTLAYFDADEIDCHGEDGADDDADAATPIDKKGWEPAEVMQLVWIRHDFDEQYRNLCRLQGQNRDVMLYEQVRLRHPGWRHDVASPTTASAVSAGPDGVAASASRAQSARRSPNPRRVTASPGHSPSRQPFSSPSTSALAPDVSPAAATATASPSRSHVVGANAGVALRGRGVSRRPGPAAAEEEHSSNDTMGGGVGNHMNSSDSVLCAEIAGIIAQLVKGAMRDQFDEFLERTQEMVERAQDARASRKRRSTPPGEIDDESE
ncbi:unnamed protein product [Closterium sp. NIES-64]|nr:unnamed protein product [Closterium sp. NIES-64]